MSCRVASALRKEPHTSRFKTTKLTVGIYISYTTYENRGFWFCKLADTLCGSPYYMASGIIQSHMMPRLGFIIVFLSFCHCGIHGWSYYY
ncbi:hypothetical protein P8452_71766 [Trifolium repens]|nr:hypothetical protein P8452_71766 [Trifolium repens]